MSDTPWSPDEAAVERIIRAVFKETRVDLRALKKDEAKKVSRAVISESPLARAVELLEPLGQEMCDYSTDGARRSGCDCPSCAARAFLRDLGQEGNRG